MSQNSHSHFIQNFYAESFVRLHQNSKEASESGKSEFERLFRSQDQASEAGEASGLAILWKLLEAIFSVKYNDHRRDSQSENELQITPNHKMAIVTSI